MSFSVLAAADLSGAKQNFELSFHSAPSLAEFRDRAVAVLRYEASLRAPADRPGGAFQPTKAQVFDEGMGMWVDLVTGGQLAHWAQVYFFQRESQWHVEAAGRIPPPARSVCAASAPRAPLPDDAPVASPLCGSPRPASPLRLAAGDAAPDPAAVGFSKKVGMVYEQLDVRRRRSVQLDDWRALLRRLRVCTDDGGVEPGAADAAFRRGCGRHGAMSHGDFERVAREHPKLLDALYYRATVAAQDQRRVERVAAARDVAAELEQRVARAQDGTAAAATATEAQQCRVADEDARVAKVRGVDEAAQQTQARVHAELEEAKGRLRGLVQQRDRRKGDLRGADSGLRATARTVKQAEQAAALDRHAAQEATRELARLKRLVDEQAAEAERLAQASAAADRMVEEHQLAAREAEAAREQAEQDVLAAVALVEGEEGEVTRLMERAEAEMAAQAETARAAAAAQRVRGEEERKLAGSRARHAQQRGDEELARRELDEQQRIVGALEQKELEIARRRTDEEEREGAILEEEMRRGADRAANREQDELLRLAKERREAEMARQRHVTSPRRDDPPMAPPLLPGEGLRILPAPPPPAWAVPGR